MAQGCHLVYSNSDREHFPITGHKEGMKEKEVKAAFKAAFNLKWSRRPSQNIFQKGPGGLYINRKNAAKYMDIRHYDRIDTFKKRMAKLSSRDKDFLVGLAMARSDVQSEFLAGFGNPHLKNEMAAALPRALQTILEQDSKATGLFEGLRKNESSWIGNLKNSGTGKADGIAYEVLASASLCSRAASDLKITHMDRLNFGQKFQARYGQQNVLPVTDGTTQDFFRQPNRTTVEADLLITRPGFGSSKEIAVDFKHSAGKAGIDSSQLKGVAVALKTGDVNEFHFVSNTDFLPTVVREVNQLNAELRNAKCSEIQLHANYKMELNSPWKIT